MPLLGHHRVNAAHSQAHKARQELARLDRRIDDAIRTGDQVKAEDLRLRRARILINSLIP